METLRTSKQREGSFLTRWPTPLWSDLFYLHLLLFFFLMEKKHPFWLVLFSKTILNTTYSTRNWQLSLKVSKECTRLPDCKVWGRRQTVWHSCLACLSPKIHMWNNVRGLFYGQSCRISADAKYFGELFQLQNNKQSVQQGLIWHNMMAGKNRRVGGGGGHFLRGFSSLVILGNMAEGRRSQWKEIPERHHRRAPFGGETFR